MSDEGMEQDVAPSFGEDGEVPADEPGAGEAEPGNVIAPEPAAEPSDAPAAESAPIPAAGSAPDSAAVRPPDSAAGSAPLSAAESAPRGARPVDLVLARLHLHVGLLGLARVELETLAGTAELDLAGILDLAEVRWRTGDIRGAGEAAAAYLALAARAGLEPDGPTAHAIVAEAAAQRGHDAEAAEAVAGSLAILRAGLDDPSALESALDRLFAGIPPRGPWPEPDQARVAPATPPRRLPWELMSGESAGEPTPSPSPGPAESTLDQAGPSPVDQLLEAGREALAGDEPGRAAVALGLALRSDPASAPAVVAAVEEVGTLSGIAEAGSGESAPGGEPGPVQDPGFAALAVVQGDALRAAGRDDEAELAYDFARKLAASGGTPATTPSPDETGQPAADGGVDRPPPGGSS